MSCLGLTAHAAILVVALTSAATAGADEMATRPLADVLRELQAEGAPLVFSTALVPDDLTAQGEPSGDSLRERILSLLVPHGLGLRDLDDGRWLVVRASAVDAAAREARIVVEDSIDVTPSRWAIYRDAPESRQFLDRGQVERLPHLADDLYRAVARLPGTAAGDISAEFNVRGGATDELLVLVDGLEVYEPFHLRDFQSIFSIVDSRAVGQVELLSGGFPTRYGDRMSGVLDITTAAPAPGAATSLGLSVLDVRLGSEGTFAGERGQWLVSARRGYLDLVLDWVRRQEGGEGGDDRLSPEYYDLFGKVVTARGERTVLAASALAAFDRLDLETDDGDQTATAKYGNAYLWLHADTLWTPRLSSRTQLSAGRVGRDRRARSDETTGRPSCAVCEDGFAEVRDERSFDLAGLKQDWAWQPSESGRLTAGLDVRRLWADVDYHRFSSVLDPLLTGSREPVVTVADVELEPEGWRCAAYASQKLQLARHWTAEAGLRWDRQTWTGGPDQWSPRLNLAWEPPVGGVLRAAWGRFHQSQGIHELQVVDGVDTFFPAERADHQLVGYERRLGGGLFVRGEVYRKELRDLRPRYVNLFEPIELVPEGASDRVRVDATRGEARGVELVVQRDAGRLGGWLSYALSEVVDEEDGRDVPRGWDQTHAVSFSLDLRLGERWSLGLAGVYHTGWPVTPVGAERIVTPDGRVEIRPVLGLRNAGRYPDYHRLDLRLSRRVATRRGRLSVFFEVTNVYDRKNVRAYSGFEYRLAADGRPVVFPEEEYWLPITPSFGLAWQL